MPSTVTPAISIRDAAVGYAGLPVQTGIDLDILPGEIFAIVGDSGSGKSTLLKTLVGLLEPLSGHVLFDGLPLEAYRREGRPPFGILFQGGALWTSMSVLENVTLPMDLAGHADPRTRTALARFKLALVGLAGDEHRYPSSLSGGMRKRAALARALALDPRVLFLDEPSAGLDPLTSRRLDQLILALRDGLGITIVLVTHELASLHGIADRMVFLDGEAHRPVALGHPAALAASAESAKVREFLALTYRGDDRARCTVNQELPRTRIHEL
jgi:phospholipid/cholesterol/gamma-HCH transport system ATP-binding protein